MSPLQRFALMHLGSGVSIGFTYSRSEDGRRVTLLIAPEFNHPVDGTHVKLGTVRLEIPPDDRPANVAEAVLRPMDEAARALESTPVRTRFGDGNRYEFVQSYLTPSGVTYALHDRGVMVAAAVFGISAFSGGHREQFTVEPTGMQLATVDEL